MALERNVQRRIYSDGYLGAVEVIVNRGRCAY